MRIAGCLAVLWLAGCSVPNPFFEFASGGATEGGTSDGSGGTQAATTQGPTSGSADSSGGVGSSGGEPPVTTSGVEPGTSSAASTSTGPESSTGLASTGQESSTGEMLCSLYIDPDFDERLQVNGLIAKDCFMSQYIYTGKLLAGNQALNFITSNTGCPNESGKGTLTLGNGYAIPVNQESACIKLIINRDGPGPDCNIGNFDAIDTATSKAILTGSFSSPDANTFPSALLTPSFSDYKLNECCPLESQDCCMPEENGDLVMAVNGVAVQPGMVASVPVAEGMANVLNIQHWQTPNCQFEQLMGRRDWVAVRQ